MAELAFEEAVRAADRASNAVDGARQRGATVFSVGVLSTTFFVQALNGSLATWGWLALLTLVLGVALPGVLILMPRKEAWVFGLQPSAILTVAAGTEGLDDAELVAGAAKSLEKHVNKSSKKVDELMKLLQLQCVALGFDIVLWTLALSTK